MAVALYMDHHVSKAITTALRSRGVDILTAHDDGRDEASDLELLIRATELQRVLFTQDHHFFHETAELQRTSVSFWGVVYAHVLKVSFGECVNDLEIIAKNGQPEEFANLIQILPL
jgi:hypothetical protein